MELMTWSRGRNSSYTRKGKEQKCREEKNLDSRTENWQERRKLGQCATTILFGIDIANKAYSTLMIAYPILMHASWLSYTTCQSSFVEG